MSLVQTERPRHAAPVPPKRRRRRIIGGTFAVLVLVAAVAVAATFYRAKLNGNGKVNASPGIVFTAASVFTTTADTCTTNLDAPANTVAVTLEGASPSECVIEFKLYRKGVHELKLQNVKWADATTETFSGAAVCGTVVPPTPATPLSVLVKFSIPAGMTDGQVFVIAPDAGIEAVKTAEWTAAACPGGAV